MTPVVLHVGIHALVVEEELFQLLFGFLGLETLLLLMRDKAGEGVGKGAGEGVSEWRKETTISFYINK